MRMRVQRSCLGLRLAGLAAYQVLSAGFAARYGNQPVLLSLLGGIGRPNCR